MKRLLLVLLLSYICGLHCWSSEDDWRMVKRAGQVGTAVGAAATIGGGVGIVWLNRQLKKASAKKDLTRFKKLMRMRSWAKNALVAGLPLTVVSGAVWKVGNMQVKKQEKIALRLQRQKEKYQQGEYQRRYREQERLWPEVVVRARQHGWLPGGAVDDIAPLPTEHDEALGIQKQLAVALPKFFDGLLAGAIASDDEFDIIADIARFGVSDHPELCTVVATQITLTINRILRSDNSDERDNGARLLTRLALLERPLLLHIQNELFAQYASRFGSWSDFAKELALHLGMLFESRPFTTERYGGGRDMNIAEYLLLIHAFAQGKNLVDQHSSRFVNQSLREDRHLHLEREHLEVSQYGIILNERALRFVHQPVNNTRDCLCGLHALGEAVTGQRFLGASLLQWLVNYLAEKPGFSLEALRGKSMLLSNPVFGGVALVTGMSIRHWRLVGNGVVLFSEHRGSLQYEAPEAHVLDVITFDRSSGMGHCEWLEHVDSKARPVRDRVAALARPLEHRINLLAQALTQPPGFWQIISNDVWVFLSLYILAQGSRLGLQFGNQSIDRCVNQIREHPDGARAVGDIGNYVVRVQSILLQKMQTLNNMGHLTKEMVDDLLVRREDGSYKWLSLRDNVAIREIMDAGLALGMPRRRRNPRESVMGPYVERGVR